MDRIDNLIISCIIHFFIVSKTIDLFLLTYIIFSHPMNGLWYLCNGTQIEVIFMVKQLLEQKINILPTSLLT